MEGRTVSLYAKFATDENLETAGVFLELEERDKPLARIKIARAGGANRAYSAAIAKVKKQYGRQFQLDAISEEKDREIMIGVAASTLIVSWETWRDEWVPGIEGPDGEVIPDNVENRSVTLKALPTIFEQVGSIATDFKLYNRAYVEEAAGKS